MNITHAKEEKINDDFLNVIFNRQKELMEKYHWIEKKSGLLQTELFPLDLNDVRSQARIKDFAWRITEEIGEALDAIHHQDKEDGTTLHGIVRAYASDGWTLCLYRARWRTVRYKYRTHGNTQGNCR